MAARKPLIQNAGEFQQLPSTDFLEVDNNVNSVAGNFRLAGELQSAAMSVGDVAGGQTFTTTPITIALDTLRTNTGGALFTHSAANDTITINRSGTYLVMADVGTNGNAGTSRSSCQAWVERNSVELAASRMNMYNRLANNGYAQASCAMAIVLAAGDNLRLRCVRTIGSDTLRIQANTTRLTVVRLSG